MFNILIIVNAHNFAVNYFIFFEIGVGEVKIDESFDSSALSKSRVVIYKKFFLY